MDTKNGTYLNREQLIKKYPFITSCMLKNILFKNIGGFRTKVVRKIGRRNLFDEEEFLKFISNQNISKEEEKSPYDKFIKIAENTLPEICSDKDLSKLKLVSCPTLFRLRKSGQGPKYFTIGNKILYLKGDVLEWIKKIYNGN